VPTAPGITYVQVHDVLYRGDGSFDSGFIEFRLTQQIHKSGAVVLTPTTWVVPVGVANDGAFSVSLPASDDTSLSPASWFYQVQVRTKEWNETFYMPVLIALAGTGATLSQLLDHVAVPQAPGFDLAGFLQKTGGTMTGALILSGDPTTALGAATKQYADNLAAAGTPDATTTAKGKIKLAGDLAGTADLPTVPALANKAAASHSHAESDVTQLVTDLNTLSTSIAGKVSSSLVTAKGDLLVATASGTLNRLGVGSNNQVLTTDSTQSTGMKWSPAASGSGPILYIPSGYGLTSVTGDPLAYQNTQSAGTNFIWYMRLPTPASGIATNLWVACGTSGAYDGTTTPNQVGIYDDIGTKLGATADDSTLWGAIGWRGGAVVGGAVSIGTPYFYLLALIRGYSNEQFCFPGAPVDSHTFASRGPGQTKRRCGYFSGATALPASFDPTTYGTESGFGFLCGVS